MNTETWETTLRFLATLGCGLMAGVFFAFSTFVMKGLSKVSPEQGIAAMQQINVYAVRSVFVVLFMGTALLCVAVIGLALRNGFIVVNWKPVAGAAIYILGGLLVTMFRNVPMNDTLAALSAGASESARYWQTYLSEWSFWNHVRTVACLVAMGCLMK